MKEFNQKHFLRYFVAAIKQVARPSFVTKIWAGDIRATFLEEESAPPILIFRLNPQAVLRGIRLPIKGKKRSAILFLALIFLVSILGIIRLKYYKNSVPLPINDTISIILSPHLDDAALSLGGMIAERNSNYYVASFFTGLPKVNLLTSWDKISGFSGSDEAVRTRLAENNQALKILGAESVNFNYFDHPYRLVSQKEESDLTSSISSDIDNLIFGFSGKNVSIYGPADFGKDITHPDHKVVHDAFLLAAARHIDEKNIHFYIYEDFPYISKFRSSYSGNFAAYLEKNLSGNIKFSFNKKFLEIDSEAMKIKQKAIGVYQSQIKAFKALGADIVNATISYNKRRCEAFYPDWSACEVVYEIAKSN